MESPPAVLTKSCILPKFGEWGISQSYDSDYKKYEYQFRKLRRNRRQKVRPEQLRNLRREGTALQGTGVEWEGHLARTATSCVPEELSGGHGLGSQQEAAFPHFRCSALGGRIPCSLTSPLDPSSITRIYDLADASKPHLQEAGAGMVLRPISVERKGPPRPLPLPAEMRANNAESMRETQRGAAVPVAGGRSPPEEEQWTENWELRKSCLEAASPHIPPGLMAALDVESAAALSSPSQTPKLEASISNSGTSSSSSMWKFTSASPTNSSPSEEATARSGQAAAPSGAMMAPPPTLLSKRSNLYCTPTTGTCLITRAGRVAPSGDGETQPANGPSVEGPVTSVHQSLQLVGGLGPDRGKEALHSQPFPQNAAAGARLQRVTDALSLPDGGSPFTSLAAGARVSKCSRRQLLRASPRLVQGDHNNLQAAGELPGCTKETPNSNVISAEGTETKPAGTRERASLPADMSSLEAETPLGKSIDVSEDVALPGGPSMAFSKTKNPRKPTDQAIWSRENAEGGNEGDNASLGYGAWSWELVRSASEVRSTRITNSTIRYDCLTGNHTLQGTPSRHAKASNCTGAPGFAAISFPHNDSTPDRMVQPQTGYPKERLPRRIMSWTSGRAWPKESEGASSIARASRWLNSLVQSSQDDSSLSYETSPLPAAKHNATAACAVSTGSVRGTACSKFLMNGGDVAEETEWREAGPGKGKLHRALASPSKCQSGSGCGGMAWVEGEECLVAGQLVVAPQEACNSESVDDPAYGEDKLEPVSCNPISLHNFGAATLANPSFRSLFLQSKPSGLGADIGPGAQALEKRDRPKKLKGMLHWLLQRVAS